MSRPAWQRAALSIALLVLGTVSAAGCSGQDEPAPAPTSAAASGPDAGPGTSAAAPPPTATAVPEPDRGACYELDYDQAVSPTSDVDPSGCGQQHTSQTFAVGTLDALVGGHLLAVDSDRVQAQVAQRCPDALGDFVGGSLEQQRLSVLRSIWFTPTVEESDAGASWYRCDVVALAGSEELAGLPSRMKDVLRTTAGRERFGLCGTAEPGTAGFARVPCGSDHRWRAIAVVGFEAARYPGEAAAKARGQQQCEDAGRDAADDPLDFSWGYEWPTAEQWAAGQTYGFCWIPD